MSIKQIVHLENYMKYKIAIHVTHQKYIYKFHNKFLNTHKQLLSKNVGNLLHGIVFLQSPHCLVNQKNLLF